MSRQDAAKIVRDLKAMHGATKTAKMLGCDRQYVYMICRGERLPGRNMLEKLGYREIKSVIKFDELIPK